MTDTNYKGLSSLRRILCQRKKLLLVFLVVTFYFWYKIFSADDLELEHNILYGEIYLDQSAESKRGWQPIKNVSMFPVIPKGAFVRATQLPPLNIDDVIPDENVLIGRLKVALRNYSSERPLVLSVVDYGFLDMTLNFIRSSVEPTGLLSSYIMVCLDGKAAMALASQGYPCVNLDLKLNDSTNASDFGTPGYYTKTNIKTWVVLQTLLLGHNVLLTDVDIVLFKNPFPYFRCAECDVTIQMDKVLYNSGFVYVRATSAGVKLYQTAWDLYLQFHTGHDQAYINIAITAMEKKNSLRIDSLSWKQFPCGAYYFEHAYRHFRNAPPCGECVMAHNNYMGTTSAKIYRFKENLMWLIDNNGYYSSKTEQYVTYENPYDFDKDTIDMETGALLNAFVIAFLTGRVLILPSFRCCNCRIRSCDHPMNRCSLLSVLNVKAFDETFRGKYREHSFLQNEQVSSDVISSQSPIVFLNVSNFSFNRTYQHAGKYVYPNPGPKHVETIENTDIVQDIKRTLERYSQYSVLRLYSIYGNLFNFSKMDIWGSDVMGLKRKGLICASYEQWDDKLTKKLLP